MSFIVNNESHIYNKTSNFNRLIERIRQCIREREMAKEQQQQQQCIKISSILHYIEHIKRCIYENPLIGRVLFQFYNTIKHFPSQNNRFPSTFIFDNNESKMNLDDKTSINNLSTVSSLIETKSDLSKKNLTISQSTELNNLQTIKSTTHFIQPFRISRQIGGLMTKATLSAITKAPRQRTTHDIEVLEHLLNRCESLRHLPTNVRRYAARSLLLFTYQPNTILTRQNFPSFLVYIIVYVFGHRLNIGDVYGDDSLQLTNYYHINGLITNEINYCNLIGFFSRDIRAYENYLSDIMKKSLLEQFRIQSIFSSIQWRNDILNYILKWSSYKQYSIDEIIYGNEEYEHENLYFILHGQISFVRLLDFPSIIIKHPEYSQYYQKLNNKKNNKAKIKQINTTGINQYHPSNDNDSILSSLNDSMNISNCSSLTALNLSVIISNSNLENKSNLQQNSKLKTTWRFLEIFILSNGHYFGFESTTIHSWYLTRSIVDIISIPKNRFKELGSFAPMIFEKLREDFLDIFPNEIFIRNSYIKYLQTNKLNENEISIIKFI
ncbi:unnamed protein product [Rotaria sordida]|uniref:Cyclic nucleotide-binding domain-containing protein n=1 Tax=Rotaria sordida TaxID=392033 RepID=A0A814Z142_9BILA|nr:unnamed protein product [Rotaria sordida]CAF1236724.1 unnamed protein product [Rotaria sordida]